MSDYISVDDLTWLMDLSGVTTTDLPENLWNNVEPALSGFNPSEKIDIVSWDDYSQYMVKIKNDPNHQPVIFSASMA